MHGSWNFRQGCGVQAQLTEKPLTSFSFLFCLSPQNIFTVLQRGYCKENYIFKVPEGVLHFPGGGGSNFFQGGGVQIQISIEAYNWN